MRKNMTSKRVMISVALVAMFLVLAPMISTRRVRANTFTVTSLNDSGAGSLRQAILDANSNPGDDTINISLTGTIPLDSALPDLSTNMTINGPGARLLTVSRNTTDRIRIFTITAGATVNISGLRVSEGYTADGTDNPPAVSGGGIYNSGTLNLTGVNVVNNHAGVGFPGQFGFGTFGGDGGGILNALGATLTLLNCTVRNNETGRGGNGLSGRAGSGGGIHNSGTLIIINSTIAANRTGDTGNSGIQGRGAGILNAPTGVITMTGSTVAQNVVPLSTIGISGAGISNDHGGTVSVSNSIIADNSALASRGPDFTGPALSGGFNLIGNDNNSSGFTQPTDQRNVSPRLFPINNYGGQTDTCALLFLSPAIDKGKNFSRDASNQLITTDQRGRPRPFDTPLPDVAGGDGSDIGAYEANDDFASLVVNSTADTNDGACDPLGTGTGNMDCTLREAINAANFDFGAETITFDPTVFTSPGPNIIQLTGPLPDIISDLSINGPSANLLSVRGGGTANRYRIFAVLPEATVNISGLTVTNGYLPDADNDGHSGAGIINFGTLNLTGVVVSGNRAGRGGDGYESYDDNGELIPIPGAIGGHGGGIYNLGMLTLLNCTISGNRAGDGGNGANGGRGGQSGGGGGIYSPSGTLNIINSTISNNQTGNGGTPNGPSSGGGGITNNATLNIINSTISGNQTGAGGQGGGIDGGTGTVTISNSTITANTATTGTGGGIFRALSTVTLKNTIVAGNSASTAPDIDGPVQSDGFNLIQSTSGTTINQNMGAGPNITNQDAQLGPLTNNGGPTDTHALNPTSPAIDKGKNFATGMDQRGYLRPVDIDDATYPDAVSGDASDIGAFEVKPCTITCPTNKIQSNDANQCGAIVNYFDPMMNGDLTCGTITCSPPSGSFFPKGTTTVVCNASGTPASSDCTFTVSVNDTQNPSIACPGNISLSTDAAQCNAVVTYKTPVASDNCSGVGSVTCTPVSGTTFQKGTTTVNCTVKDASNNNGACSFTVTINDTQNPAIVAPANIIRTTDANLCNAVVTYTTPTASDNCSAVGSVTCTPASGTTFQKGVTTVTCSVTDASNNTGTGTFTVTVNDNQPPSITCLANITIVAAPACPAITGKVATFATPTASDNCSGVPTVVCNPPSGSTFPLGVTTVTCTAKDAANNSATCSFTVNFSFNACIQDDSNSGNVILFNTVTGAYRICCNGTVMATGVGTVSLQGCDLTLQHNEGARRVMVKWSSTTFKGSATVNILGSNLTCTITDRDIRNNTCNCQ
jgi:CSLREA domain-containing protein